MANLTWIPLQDNYNAILTQEWDWQVWTIFVDRVPDFTFPVGETTFIVVNAGTTSAQLAEIDSYDAVNSTLNVTNVSSLELWEWVSSTTQIHPTNSRVLISDNFQFWKAIKTAITTKINTDEDSTIEDWIKLYFWADAYITTDDDWVNLKFKDWSNPEIDLSTLAAWAWADTKFSISVSDTTSWTFTDKIVDWDWITWTINNPWAAETYQLDIDLATDSWLEFDSWQLQVSTDVKNPKKVLRETFTAWENINIWEAFRYWDNTTSKNVIVNDIWTNASFNVSWIGYNTSNRRAWQSFLVNDAWWLSYLDIAIVRNNNPTWNLTCKVYSDLGVTVVATSTNTIAESSLPTASRVFFRFNFSWEALTGSTTYYFAVETDRWDNTTNFSSLLYSTSNPYAWGVQYEINSLNTWSANSSNDVAFKLWTTLNEDNTRVYKTDASDLRKVKSKWIANETVTTWNDFVWNIEWIDENQSGLTIWEEMFLSNTPWQISNTPWTFRVNIGQASTATNLILNTIDWFNFIEYWKNKEWLTASRDLSTPSSTQTISHNLWRMPQLIQIQGTKQWAVPFITYASWTELSWTVWVYSSNSTSGFGFRFADTTFAYVEWVVNNVTNTSFDIVWTRVSNPSWIGYVNIIIS